MSSPIYFQSVNQNTAIGTPAVASVNGLANRTNTVTVNSAATVRQGEYWWKETTVNNVSTPVWASLNVAASNGGSTNSTVNRYVHKASEVPSHDEDGNQTGDGRWHYRWDAENRLVEMETTTAATTAGAPYGKVRWTYDPLGRRIQRQSWQGANPVVATKYVYDGWQCIAEPDGSNVVTATYAWGKDLSGSVTGAGGVGGLLWVHHSQHGRHFYAYDGNGNVCGLTSATDGTRSGGYEYDPFGGVIRVDAVTPVASWNEWQFSTKRKDGVAEVVLYEYRGCDVRTGIWLSRDPIEEAGGKNLSGFVGSDPIKRIDPEGLAFLWDTVVACSTSIGGKALHKYLDKLFVCGALYKRTERGETPGKGETDAFDIDLCKGFRFKPQFEPGYTPTSLAKDIAECVLSSLRGRGIEEGLKEITDPNKRKVIQDLLETGSDYEAEAQLSLMVNAKCVNKRLHLTLDYSASITAGGQSVSSIPAKTVGPYGCPGWMKYDSQCVCCDEKKPK